MAEAFILLESERGRSALRAYFDRYVPLAVDRGVGSNLARQPRLGGQDRL
jgi:hypothetical protein